MHTILHVRIPSGVPGIAGPSERGGKDMYSYNIKQGFDGSSKYNIVIFTMNKKGVDLDRTLN